MRNPGSPNPELGVCGQHQCFTFGLRRDDIILRLKENLKKGQHGPRRVADKNAGTGEFLPHIPTSHCVVKMPHTRTRSGENHTRNKAGSTPKLTSLQAGN